MSSVLCALMDDFCTMTAKIPNQGTVYGHLLPMFRNSVINSMYTDGHKNSYMPGSNILSKYEHICLKIVMCSLNNMSIATFSVYSFEIFYICFQPPDGTFFWTLLVNCCMLKMGTLVQWYISNVFTRRNGVNVLGYMRLHRHRRKKKPSSCTTSNFAESLWDSSLNPHQK
jgi:hypothetical protein